MMFGIKEKVTGFFNAIGRALRMASLYLLLVAGLVMTSLAIGCSFFVSLKALAIAVASAGSIAGTAIVCLVIQKIIRLKGDAHHSELSELKAANAALGATLKQEREARATLADRCGELDEEVAHLKRMRVDVNRVTPILKLALLEFEGARTDFCRRPLGTSEGFISTTTQEYIGVYQIDYKSMLGVDLLKTRVRKDGNGLVVSGLTPEFLGFQKYEDVSLMNEVRSFKERLIGRDTAVIETKDPRMHGLAEEQRLSARKRLELGFADHGSGEAALRLAKAFLANLLGPLDCTIQFADADSAPSLPLMLFLEENNRAIEKRIAELRQERLRLTSGRP